MQSPWAAMPFGQYLALWYNPVYQARRCKELSRGGVAAFVGCHPATIRRAEVEGRVSKQFAPALALALDLSLSELDTQLISWRAVWEPLID